MSYRVKSGFVTVETQVNDRGGRAGVDVPRGADLPSDVPAEQVTELLRLGRIEVVEPVRVSEPAKKVAAKKAVVSKSDN